MAMEERIRQRRVSPSNTAQSLHSKETVEKKEETVDYIPSPTSWWYSVQTIIRGVGFYTFLLSSTIFTLYPLLWLRATRGLLKALGVKMRKHPLDLVATHWSKMLLLLAGIEVEVTGADKVDTSNPVIFMYNHLSNLDPFLAVGWGPVETKFIFKQDLIWFQPWFGILFWIGGHIPINRKNRESAILSLKAAGRTIRTSLFSVSLFPEGTRSATGRLQPFKKGGFYLARESGVPVIPVVISGSFQLWKPGAIFGRPGIVSIRFLSEIKSSEHASVDSLSQAVETSMKRELSKVKNDPSLQPNNSTERMEALVCLPAFAYFLCFLLLLLRLFHVV